MTTLRRDGILIFKDVLTIMSAHCCQTTVLSHRFYHPPTHIRIVIPSSGVVQGRAIRANLPGSQKLESVQ
jgi:hypothetical protein